MSGKESQVMKKFKNWLIKKLGGCTKEAYDHIIKENIQFARDIETLSNREDIYKEEIKKLNNLIEKDNDIFKVAHAVFEPVVLRDEYIIPHGLLKTAPDAASEEIYVRDMFTRRLTDKVKDFIEIKDEPYYLGISEARRYVATIVVGKKGSYR